MKKLLQEFKEIFKNENELTSNSSELSIEQFEKLPLGGIDGKYILKVYEKNETIYLLGSFTDNLMKQTATYEINLGSSFEAYKHKGKLPELIGSLKNEISFAHLKCVQDWRIGLYDKVNRAKIAFKLKKEIDDKKNERKKLLKERENFIEASVTEADNFKTEMKDAIEKSKKGDSTIDMSKYDIENMKKYLDTIEKKIDSFDAKIEALDKETEILLKKAISFHEK